MSVSDTPPAGGASLGTAVKSIAANRPLIGCWLITFGAAVMSGGFFTFLPLLGADRGLDVKQIGIVYLVQSVSNALSRIPFGAVSDRLGRRHYQAMAGALLVTLCFALLAGADTFAGFLLTAAGLGTSMAVAFTSIGALIAETSAPQVRGLAMGGYNSCIYFGLMAGSLGAGPLIEMQGYYRSFLFLSVMNLPFIAAFVASTFGYAKQR
jgi:MFS family permease